MFIYKYYMSTYIFTVSITVGLVGLGARHLNSADTLAVGWNGLLGFFVKNHHFLISHLFNAIYALSIKNRPALLRFILTETTLFFCLNLISKK